MIPSHLLAGPSSGSSIRRASLPPPGSAHLPRRGSSLRQTSSACDLMEDTEEDGAEEDGAEGEGEHDGASARACASTSSRSAWRPSASPTTSESDDNDDACDFQDHFPSPPSTSSSSSSLSILDERSEERPSRSTLINGNGRCAARETAVPNARTCPAFSAPPSSASATASTSQSHRRPRGLVPLSTISAHPVSDSYNNSSSSSTNNNSSGGALSLPKAQPLARTLFARMADTPHAGMGMGGLGLMGGSGNRKGGKPKMLIATKPMRTTFELGLTSSELARRA